MLKVEKLTKKFNGLEAINNCSLNIPQGHITSIIGPNGAGKTTLFNAICGITKPTSGKIFFKQKEITTLQAHKIANLGISRTFQQGRLFRNLTIVENLSLAKKTTEEEIAEVLHKVGLQLPLDTLASHLSFGQTRLVEVARAILHPHEILLLDEPTAGVNPQIRRELKSLLLRLKKDGSTIALIEHDMDFVMALSDHVIVMAAGKVLVEGSPSEIQNDKRVLEAYLGK